MKKAFTMIELIFVIVIIGILAAVAIPKLAATRDDAKIANIITNVRTLLRDAPAYYTSQGPSIWANTLAATTTSVLLYTDATCSTTAIADTTLITGGPFYFCDEKGGNLCLTVDINQTAINVLAEGTNADSPICNGIIADPAIIGITGGADSNKTITLGGVAVVR